MTGKAAELLRKYAAGIELIKQFEGCHLKAYPDSATGGAPWTIGWGNTRHIDGAPVKARDTISQAVADDLLVATIEHHVLPAIATIPHWGAMSAEQQGALLSFAWNLGWGFYGAEGFETITRCLKDKDWPAVPKALELYRNPGSNVEAGLLRRRKAEGKLWSTGLVAAAKPSPAAPPQGNGAVLLTLEALQNTWLKKQPSQADQLDAQQKVAVHKGRTYGVVTVTELPASGHMQVELAAGAGTWFIYAPHWDYQQRPSGEALLAEVDWSDFDCLVTPNLTVGEVLQWDRRRIPGPNAAVRQRLLTTAAEFQKIRDAWGRPLGVTSFYRPEPINRAVGGATSSRHVTGQAMDIYPVGSGIQAFYDWIKVRWRGGLGDGRPDFVHLDTDGGGFSPGGGATPSRFWNY